MVKIIIGKAQFEVIQRAAYFYYVRMNIDLEDMINGNFNDWDKYDNDFDYSIIDPVNKLYEESKSINIVALNQDFLSFLLYQRRHNKSELSITTDNVILLHEAVLEFYFDLEFSISDYEDECEEQIEHFNYEPHSGKGQFIKFNSSNINYFINQLNEAEELFYLLRQYFENNYSKSREEQEKQREQALLEYQLFIEKNKDQP